MFLSSCRRTNQAACVRTYLLLCSIRRHPVVQSVRQVVLLILSSCVCVRKKIGVGVGVRTHVCCKSCAEVAAAARPSHQPSSAAIDLTRVYTRHGARLEGSTPRSMYGLPAVQTLLGRRCSLVGCNEVFWVMFVACCEQCALNRAT